MSDMFFKDHHRETPSQRECRMSDSEGSVASPNGSEKSATHDEAAETMPTRQNDNGDKPEEFEKLLQSMIVIHSTSEEEEQLEEEDNANEKKIVGRSIFISTA